MEKKLEPMVALEFAWKDMVAVLFTPFMFGRWLLLGIPLFLVNCAGGGYTGNMNFRGNVGGGPNPFEDIVYWIDRNMAMVTMILAALLIVLAIFTAIAAYLHARGVFMLIAMLSTGIFSLSNSWNNSTRPAFSLFLYQLIVSMIWLILPATYFLLVLGWPFLRGVLLGQSNFWEILGVVGGFLIVCAILWIPLTALHIVVRNFTIPVMAATGQSFMPATREAFRLILSNPGASSLFLLLMFGISIAGGILVALLSCLLTCFLIGCIPILGPYVIAVLSAPFAILTWALSFRFVEQFGERYRVLPDFLGMPPAPPLPVYSGPIAPPGSGPYAIPQSWPPAPMPPTDPPPDQDRS